VGEGAGAPPVEDFHSDLPEVDESPHERLQAYFFIMDDFEGGAAVACGASGLSGQWVKGADVADAYRNWDIRYLDGKLTE